MSEPSNESIDNSPNPYAYLNRDDFTSEKFKIEVRGLPKFYGIKEFKKLLNEKLNLDICKIKPPKQGKGCGWAFVCFRSEDAREFAITTIDGFTWKNSKLTAKKAKPAPDPYIKRKLKTMDEQCKRLKNDEELPSVSIEDQVKTSTTPLWNVPYSEQLSSKQKKMREVLVTIGQMICKNNGNLIEWANKQRTLNDGLICELKPILSTNTTEGYRNKCEFTIGKNHNGDKTVGFRLSHYAISTTVGPIDELCHIPENMKVAVKIVQEFIQNSDLKVYDPVDHSGYWHQLTARTTRLGHLMLVIGLYPQSLTSDELTDLKTKITTFFEHERGKDAQVTSLYFQLMSAKTAGGENDGSLHHLSGLKYVEESLLHLKFRISPQAFFQVNTLGAEILFQAAIELAQCDNENTSLLDICCGTGTIGLCFAKYCSEVLGLEMVGDAIKDAKENARINNIDNCDFFVGKAEDIVKAVIHRATKRDIIAIVDPPRAGLHQQALLALRRTKKLNKLLYISCDPKAAIKNLVDFARPSSKLYVGEPLVPVKAIPVDMFPHTNHCELIILLERIVPTINSM